MLYTGTIYYHINHHNHEFSYRSSLLIIDKSNAKTGKDGKGNENQELEKDR